MRNRFFSPAHPPAGFSLAKKTDSVYTYIVDKNTVEQINRIVKRIKDGEIGAVRDLHALLGNRIKFISLKFMKDSFDAEDETQEFWAKITVYCAKCGYFTNAADFLCACFVNQCRMRLRAKKREIRTVTLEDVERFETGAAYYDTDVRRYALKQSFDRAKKKMSDEEKLVFALICYEEMSVREAAKELGWSKSKAERVRQGMMKILKQTLTEDGWDDR